MQKYGLVKTIGEGESAIKLVGNALTFVVYKNYFGKDLLNDIIGFAKKNSGAADLNPNNISLDNIDSFDFDSEFILQLIASLMATAQYPIKPDIGELIMSIPPHFIMDTEVITQLLEFLSLFVNQKKA